MEGTKTKQFQGMILGSETTHLYELTEKSDFYKDRGFLAVQASWAFSAYLVSRRRIRPTVTPKPSFLIDLMTLAASVTGFVLTDEMMFGASG